MIHVEDTPNISILHAFEFLRYACNIGNDHQV